MSTEFYSLTEAVLGKLSPLRWSEDSGALEVDVGVLQESGARHAKLWLMLSGLFLCVSVLLGDLLFAVSATAKLATLLTGAAAVASLTIAAAITALRSSRR